MKDSVSLLLLLIVIATLHTLKIKQAPSNYVNTKASVKKIAPGNASNQVILPAKYISSKKAIQNNFSND
jgi:hypothetical protein